MFRWLLTSGANPNLCSTFQLTPLMELVIHGNVEMIKEILKYKANPNAAYSGITVLQLAIEAKEFVCAEILLKHGADPNFKLEDGDTFLCLAAREGKIHLVELLLQFGVDCNQVGKNGMTPLGCATDDAIISLLKSAMQAQAVKEFKSSTASPNLFSQSKASPSMSLDKPSSLRDQRPL